VPAGVPGLFHRTSAAEARGCTGGYRRKRIVASSPNETPTTSSKSGTSRCHPSGVPGAYSATRTCTSASEGTPSQRQRGDALDQLAFLVVRQEVAFVLETLRQSRSRLLSRRIEQRKLRVVSHRRPFDEHRIPTLGSVSCSADQQDERPSCRRGLDRTQGAR